MTGHGHDAAWSSINRFCNVCQHGFESVRVDRCWSAFCKHEFQVSSFKLRDLNRKICVTLQPIFVSKKLEQDLKPKEIKPSIANRQCVVYKFACDLCDADYVGYTARHLHQRIAEHKYWSIGKHLLEAHGDKNLLNEGQFRVLKKCHGKFDCLVYEMLFIQELKPSLNTQSDSISAKLFV